MIYVFFMSDHQDKAFTQFQIFYFLFALIIVHSLLQVFLHKMVFIILTPKCNCKYLCNHDL